MTQQTIRSFAEKHNQQSQWPHVQVGMTVRVHQKLREGEKGKSQIFEGIVIARKHGDEPGATITVRRTAGGFGVEKVYPLRLPSIEKIEVVKAGRTRRAKMYYLREKSAKEVRKKTRAEAAALRKMEETQERMKAEVAAQEAETAKQQEEAQKEAEEAPATEEKPEEPTAS